MWRHRYLEAVGVYHRVVDSASIAVKRRLRRAKTDGLDVGQLLNLLGRYPPGEAKVWRGVQVRSAEVEAQRQWPGELMAWKREPTQPLHRMKGWLASQGVVLAGKRDFVEELAEGKLGDGSQLGGSWRTLRERDASRWARVQPPIPALENERKDLRKHSTDPAVAPVRRWKGLGLHSAWVEVMEFFAGREFHNRRDGRPPPSAAERALGKSGSAPPPIVPCEPWPLRLPGRGCGTSPTVRRWERKRFAKGGSRVPRLGIVALARKLWITGWR